MEVKFTKHATIMLKERGFTVDQIEEAVRNPGWTEKNELLHIFKREGSKVLHVIGKEEAHNVYKVITVYYDRRKK